ncbi:MAG: prepilin-type N-terminal cleavage/methylation domain-containing protein [Verrucomicrobiota bacterium]
MWTRVGFTLVELLVTIGIVSILIALLLPALNRSRERAKMVKCQTTLRQVFLATVTYADDHNGRLPARSFFVQETNIPPLCPSAKLGPHASPAYGGFEWGIPFLRETRFANVEPTQWLAQDSIPWHDPGRTFTEGLGWSGRHNVLFGNGQVESKRYGYFKK